MVTSSAGFFAVEKAWTDESSFTTRQKMLSINWEMIKRTHGLRAHGLRPLAAILKAQMLSNVTNKAPLKVAWSTVNPWNDPTVKPEKNRLEPAIAKLKKARVLTITFNADKPAQAKAIQLIESSINSDGLLAWRTLARGVIIKLCHHMLVKTRYPCHDVRFYVLWRDDATLVLVPCDLIAWDELPNMFFAYNVVPLG